MSAPPPELDVVVIGGGPAGATTAACLARRGRSACVLEREPFPRFHVGESLLPRADAIYRELGFDLEAAGVRPVVKWGATFVRADGTKELNADFRRAVETEQPRAFHVDRARFDTALLEHARSSGADVRQPARATDFRIEDDRVVVLHEDARGRPGRIDAKAVVDCSGRAGLVTRRLGERRVEPRLRNVAAFSRYEGVARSGGERAGDIRVVTRPDRGWVWLIPLSETSTSVGAVVPQELHSALGLRDPEAALEHYIATTPALEPLFAGARRSDETRFESDYSYEAERHCGDRWLSAGDSGAFLDPIFSTGVLLAMEAGRSAAETLDRALRRGDLSARALRGHQHGVRRRYRFFRQFALGFYEPSFRGLLHEDAGRFGIFEAVLSMLAGNWDPSWRTRLRLLMFKMVVASRRRFGQDERPARRDAGDPAEPPGTGVGSP